MSPVYVIEAVRTPFGRFAGALSGERPEPERGLQRHPLLMCNRSRARNLVNDVGCQP